MKYIFSVTFLMSGLYLEPVAAESQLATQVYLNKSGMAKAGQPAVKSAHYNKQQVSAYNWSQLESAWSEQNELQRRASSWLNAIQIKGSYNGKKTVNLNYLVKPSVGIDMEIEGQGETYSPSLSVFFHF